MARTIALGAGRGAKERSASAPLGPPIGRTSARGSSADEAMAQSRAVTQPERAKREPLAERGPQTPSSPQTRPSPHWAELAHGGAPHAHSHRAIQPAPRHASLRARAIGGTGGPYSTGSPVARKHAAARAFSPARMVMTMMRWTWLALVLSIGVGCGGEEAASNPEPQTEAEAAPAAPEPAPAEGPRIEHETFELVATPSGPYSAGQEGKFEIRLVPRGEWHVNVDPLFPFGIALDGPDAVSFGEQSLDREDAEEFTEQRARFEVPFTPSAAGEHRVTATVDFAVCTPSTCLPEQRTLAVVLPVQ